MESLLLLRSDRDKQHEWTRYVPSSSVRRDFEVRRKHVHARFLHPRGDSTARVVSMYLSVKISLSQGLGSDTKEIFLLASKLLVVYQAIMYPTAFPLYCHLSPLPPFPTGFIFDFALELLITIILGSRTKHELVRITAA